MPPVLPSQLQIILEIGGITFGSSVLDPIPTSGSLYIESGLMTLIPDDLISVRVRITAGSIGFSMTESNSVIYCSHGATQIPSNFYL